MTSRPRPKSPAKPRPKPAAEKKPASKQDVATRKAAGTRKDTATKKKPVSVRESTTVVELPHGDAVVVKGARHHNLKNIDVTVPRNQLTVVCGVSGSGKSSLAFDTLFAEGQRRYIESLSSYARQFLGQIDKPDVDSIDGLSPAVAIDQKSTSHNPRSTVGTVTELWDHLRLLYARVGVAHCTACGTALDAVTPGRLADRLLGEHAGSTVTILAPLVRDRKGSHEQLYAQMLAAGYSRARTDGAVHRLDDPPQLERNLRHRIELVVDRVTIDKDAATSRRQRLLDAIETAFKEADGNLVVDDNGTERRYSSKLACPDCGQSRDEIEPRSFSFNSPYGACDHCDGLGSELEVDIDTVVPDPSRSLADGAIEPWEGRDESRAHFQRLLGAVVKHHGGTMTTPWSKLPAKTRRAILDGDRTLTVRTVWETRWETREYDSIYEGVRPWIRRRYDNTSSDSERDRWSRYLRPEACATCSGTRLRPEALSVTVADRTIAETAALPVSDLRTAMAAVRLDAHRMLIAERLLKEINARLAFLDEVGLGYLTLSRSATTLSGGEAQRIRLATQIGSGLTGVLYVLDEPSIGLHPRDNQKLIATLKHLRDIGNTVLVVEHDEETIAAADWAIEIGPYAGELGGELTYQGPADGLATSDTVTGDYLAGRRSIPTPATRRSGNGQRLVVRGISEHNVTNLDVTVPLGRLVCVTGVSGSGKSTVVSDVLAAALARHLNRSNGRVGKHRRIDGLEHLDKLVVVDQSPIGRTPRSNPVTYTGVFDEIRQLFAGTTDARTRGYQPGRFSFNVRGGRCEPCQGEGTVKIEMNFLPDVYVPCEHCDGRRYNAETLEVRYKGKSIADVLAMTIDDACEFFTNVPTVSRKLTTLKEVGLGYIRLGQPATTLSGGEAQRVKLASELQKRSTGRTMYILDEPTTGLHFDDVAKLVAVLGRLCDGGNSIVVIEHNLDVIRVADHVIDLGPEGGPGGGTIVGEGTPEQVAKLTTATGRALRIALATAQRRTHN